MKLPFRIPFSLPKLNIDLSDIFNFSRKELRIIIVSGGAVILIAVVLSIIVGSGGGGEGVKLNAGSAVPLSSLQSDAAAQVIKHKPFLSDFIIYDDRLEESFTGTVRFREPMDTWSKEMAERFWIEPDEIAVDLMELESRKVIKGIFADVQ